MSQAKPYDDLHINFRDNPEWLAGRFSGMTSSGYRAFINYCFEQLDSAAATRDRAEFRRVKNLLLASARKELEIAHLMSGLSDEQRTVSAQVAASYNELAKGFYPADTMPAVEAAWNSSPRHAANFSWPSVFFDILEPSKVFREEGPEL